MTGKQTIYQLEATARRMRHMIVDMVGCTPGKTGHLGGSCSAVDVVAALYFYKMNVTAQTVNDNTCDRFILSKGHGALVQYAALCEMGVIDASELGAAKTLGSRLQGHPDRNKTPGILANTGSLGQGLSIGLGVALGQRMDNIDAHVYVMMGDGELAEGQIWEAAMAAAHYRCNKLAGIVDNNLYESSGSVEQMMSLGDLAGKWHTFGWHVLVIDGHDMQAICNALDQADVITDRPVVIIANTVKGKGVTFAENTHAFHNADLTREKFDLAHAQIDGQEGASHV